MRNFFSRIKNKIKIVFPAFFFIFFFSLIPLLWFRENMIMVGHDNVFPLNVEEFLYDRFFTWSEHHGFGYDQSSGMGSLTIHIIDSIPYFLGFDIQTTQKIVYCFWTFLLLLSSFIFVFYLERLGYIKNKYSKYLFAIFYTFNFYTLQAWWIGERTKFSVMVALPLLLLILFSLYRNNKLFLHSIIAAFVLTIFNGAGWRGIPLYGGMGIVIICLYIFFFIHLIKEKRYRIILSFMLFLPLVIVFFLLLNAYSTFPFLSHTLSGYIGEIQRIGGAENTFGWLEMISKDASYINLLRLQGIPEWYTDINHAYGQNFINNPLLIVISYFFPFLFILAFFLIKSKKEMFIVYLFGFIAIVSLIFSAGAHEPFGFFYKFLVKNLPGFAIFRSALYKFGYAMWFSVGLLIAYSLGTVINRVLYNKTNKIINSLPLVIIVVGYLFYHYPFLTGEIFSWSNGRLSNRVAIPAYVYQVDEWIQDNVSYGKIALVPPSNPNWTADIYKWKYFSLYPLMANLSRKPYVYNNDTLSSEEKVLLSNFYNSILRNDIIKINLLSKVLGIQYVIVRNDYYFDLDWAITDNPQLYSAAIKNNSLFSHMNSFGEWEIYKINSIDALPITISNNISFFDNKNILTQSNLLGELIEIDHKMKNSIPLLKENVKNDREKIFNSYLNVEYRVAECVSCDALLKKIPIVFPELKILPNSFFYRFNKNEKRNFLSDEEKVKHLLGNLLIYSQQLHDLSIQYSNNNPKIESAIYNVISEYDIAINELETTYKKIKVNVKDEIQYGTEIQQYLEKIDSLLDFIIRKNKIEKYIKSLNPILSKIKNLKLLIYTDFSHLNFYEKSYYFINVEKDKKYNVKLFPKSESENNISIMNTNTIILPSNHKKIIQEPKVLYYYHKMEEDKNTCYGYLLGKESVLNNLKVNISLLGNNIDRLKFVIFPVDKEYQEMLFTDDIYTEYIDNNKTKIQKIDYLLQNIAAREDFFVGLCSPNLDINLIKLLIDEFIIYDINKSVLLLTEKKENNVRNVKNDIFIEKINSTKYTLWVKNPDILNLLEKYNSDWKIYINESDEKDFNLNENKFLNKESFFDKDFFYTWYHTPLDEDRHFVGNFFHNSWLINKKGYYKIIIEYNPQKLFIQGVIVSSISWIVLLSILFILSKKRYENN